MLLCNIVEVDCLWSEIALSVDAVVSPKVRLNDVEQQRKDGQDHRGRSRTTTVKEGPGRTTVVQTARRVELMRWP